MEPRIGSLNDLRIGPNRLAWAEVGLKFSSVLLAFLAGVRMRIYHF